VPRCHNVQLNSILDTMLISESDVMRSITSLKNKSTLYFKKTSPFYFWENLAKYYSISIIFGSSIPEEICKKNLHVYPPHLFTVL